MFTFNKLPATPGSLVPTKQLVRLINGTDDLDIYGVGLVENARSGGKTLIKHIEPPTVPNAFEVAYSMSDKLPNAHTDKWIAFMNGIVEGAIEYTLTAQGAHNV